MGLLLTFITGLFFLLGIFLNKVCKNKHEINVIAISLAFIVLLNLICFDIGPEVFENFSVYNLLFIFLGITILKIMDLFVPHHSHEHHEKNDNLKEHNNHLEHISIITILALTLHNIIECMALYSLSGNIKSGLLMCLAIGFHNVPLGFQIGSSLKKNENLYISILTLSGFGGGLISYFIGSFSEMWTGYILSFTLGMLIYLTLFELLKEVWTSRKNINTLYGIIIGIVVIIISKLL